MKLSHIHEEEIPVDDIDDTEDEYETGATRRKKDAERHFMRHANVRNPEREEGEDRTKPYEVLFYVQIYDEHALQPGAGDRCKVCKKYPVKSSKPWWDELIIPKDHFDDTEDEYGDPQQRGIFEIRVMALNKSQPRPPSMMDIDWKIFQDPNHHYGSIYGYWANVSSYHGKVREIEIVQNGTYYCDDAWRDFLTWDDKTIWDASDGTTASLPVGATRHWPITHMTGKFMLQVPMYPVKGRTYIGVPSGGHPMAKRIHGDCFGDPNYKPEIKTNLKVKYLKHISLEYDKNMI